MPHPILSHMSHPSCSHASLFVLSIPRADPPAFGRGGEKRREWRIERDLPLLLESVPRLLSDEPSFVLLTAHDARWSLERLQSELLDNAPMLKRTGRIESGAMVLRAEQGGHDLPLGDFVRWSSDN